MTRRIDLKLALTLCIVGLSALSFAAASVFVLIEADVKSQARTREAADLVARNLAIQLAQSAWARTSPQPFPELERSSALLHIPGLCIAFKPVDGAVVQRICGGTESDDHKVPGSFAWLYRQIFHPGREVAQAVMDGDQVRGYAVVLVDPASEIGAAWRETSHLLGVIGVTLVGMCFLVFGGLTLVLRPTRTVLRGLERLAEGDLSARLPEFGINELSHVATGFNRLAENLDANIRERIELTKRLIATQEDERQNLARELHDEFGQCLAGIAAAAASAGQTARSDCPDLLPECEMIGKTAVEMMETLRGALMRLRPPDIAQLGLTASLQGLVAAWNGRERGHTRFRLEVSGNVEELPENLSLGLYRIAQEAITNAAKHAEAKTVKVCLRNEAPQIELVVEDDGKASDINLPGKAGMGLLGIRERIVTLGGTLSLSIGRPTGLKLRAVFPLPEDGHERPAA